MSMNTYPYLINGQWQESTTNETIELVSPYTDEVVGHVQAMSRDEVDEAIHGAKSAQQEWAALPVNKRAELLYAWADKLEERVDEIGQIIMREVGKNLSDAKKKSFGQQKSSVIRLKKVFVSRAALCKGTHSLAARKTRWQSSRRSARCRPRDFTVQLPGQLGSSQNRPGAHHRQRGRLQTSDTRCHQWCEDG